MPQDKLALCFQGPTHSMSQNRPISSIDFSVVQFFPGTSIPNCRPDLLVIYNVLLPHPLRKIAKPCSKPALGHGVAVVSSLLRQ